ncbi:MAG: hypothetical protein H0V17_25415 [Deltaproteobacteria bacterium]|nr:hypothetical protein [Deltaproteobacteria bacterium]
MTTTPLLALLLMSTAASANVVASDGGYASPEGGTNRPPRPTRVEGRVGMLMGGSDVGDADGFSLGVSAGLGYRIGDVTLRALFDHYKVGDGADEVGDRRGRGTRLGGAARYSFANTSTDKSGKGLGVDFWGEVGFGVEHITWRQGGVLDRPSGEVAVGFELDGFGERNDRTRRRRHIGYFMAFRSLIAQGPEMDGPAVCGGPCTKATKPSRTDISMFFEVGLHWGR